MKFKLIEKFNDYLTEQKLDEASLTSIQHSIASLMTNPGIASIVMDNSKKWYLITTSLGNEFCIPVRALNLTNSSDYKKLRYTGNGSIINGEVYDPAGVHIGRAYYGVPTNHNHFDYDNIQLYPYSKHPAANGSGISLSQFVNDANNKIV